MPSIDRSDNDKGYTEDNCRVVLWLFNQARSNLSDSQFYDLLKKVVGALRKMQCRTPDGRRNKS